MPEKPAGRRFETTRWNLVLAAAGAPTPDSRAALAALCEQYWYPLYAYLRATGHSANNAEDLTQGFFLRLLEKDALQAVDPERGRFRSFLLAAIKHFAANEWDRSRAQKRGGAQPPLPLELSTGEERYQAEPRDNSTPETAYDRQWAHTVLNRATKRLGAEFTSAGKETLFRHLELHLAPDVNAPPYAETAAATGMSEGAVKVAVHRLRRRYGELLQDEIAQTVASPEQVQDEIRHLISTIADERRPL